MKMVVILSGHLLRRRKGHTFYFYENGRVESGPFARFVVHKQWVLFTSGQEPRMTVSKTSSLLTDSLGL